MATNQTSNSRTAASTASPAVSTTTAPAPSRRPFRWPHPVRRTLLVTHILSGVGWMGLDVGLFLLVITGLTTDSATTAASVYTAIAVIVPVAVPVLSLGMLVTGIALGKGTKWGLLRYWWVAVKLTIGIVLTILVGVALVPGVNALPSLGVDAMTTADDVRALVGEATTSLLFPPIVSFTLLGVSLVLSVTKPWGRLRGRPSSRATGPT